MVVELPGGETLRGVTAIVQNGDPFTYFQNRPLHVAEGATLDQPRPGGRGAAPLDADGHADGASGGSSPSARGIVRHRAITGFSGSTELVVRSEDGRELPIEVDGDYIGTVPEAAFGLEPGALTVVS